MKKRWWITAVTALWAVSAAAQGLVLGEKGPDLKVGRWLTPQPSRSGKATLLEFFYSSSAPSRERLSVLDGLADEWARTLDVIVIAREPEEKIAPLLDGREYAFSVALDDQGRTFAAYEVRFVPFGVLFDDQGRVVWFGNSSKLTEEVLREALGQ